MNDIALSLLSIIVFLPLFYFAFKMGKIDEYMPAKGILCEEALKTIGQCLNKSINENCTKPLSATITVDDQIVTCGPFIYSHNLNLENGTYHEVFCEGRRCRPN